MCLAELFQEAAVHVSALEELSLKRILRRRELVQTPVESQEPDPLVQEHIYIGSMSPDICMRFIHVLESDDFFGLFAWGAGGIVHIHLLRWLAGRGRYDHVAGAVPGQCQSRDACDLAAGHLAELTEWGLQCLEKSQRREREEDLPIRRSVEPLQTDEDSDGPGSDSACSDCSDDPGVEATQAVCDDEQRARLPDGRLRKCEQWGHGERGDAVGSRLSSEGVGGPASRRQMTPRGDTKWMQNVA